MQVLHAPVRMSNQNYTIEFAVACRKKKIISDFLQGQEVKLNVVVSGAGGSLEVVYFVSSSKAKERKGRSSEPIFAFPHADEGVTSSNSLREWSPMSQTERPDAL